jgi:5-formyltetrahydrofolate cyclo-ligase
MPKQANDKATARSRFVNDRCTLGNHSRRCESSAAVKHLLRAPEVTSANTTTVCAYVSFGTEPETGELIEGLAARDITVLLPVLLPDADLDWAAFEPGMAFGAGRLGLREPTGERRGPDSIRDAQVVVVPALAVSSTGQRLGRGGGSYDRALARLADLDRAHRPWVCALVYDHETSADFRVEPHDQPVDAACSARGIVRFGEPRATEPPTTMDRG